MAEENNFSAFYIQIIKDADKICINKYNATICERFGVPQYVMEMLISLLKKGWAYFDLIVKTLRQKYIPFKNSLKSMIWSHVGASIWPSFSFGGMERGVEKLYYHRDFVDMIYNIAESARKEYVLIQNDEKEKEMLKSRVVDELVNVICQ